MKKKIINSILCIAMCTMIMCTTVMGAMVSRSKNVRNVSNYTNTYNGSYGNYCAAGDSSYARISVQNTTTTSHLYRCSVLRYNFNSLTYDLSDDGSKILSNGETTSAKISRNKNSYVYNYVHYANSFASTSDTSSTMVDSYTFIAKQYYD